MNTIEIIKNVITEQLQITGLADIEVATIESLQPISIKLANDKVLSKEFLSYTPKMMYLKNTNNLLELNNKILVQKKLGGQQYVIFDTLEDTTINNTISTITSISPLTIKLANDKVLEDNNLIILSEKLSHLKNTSDTNELGQQLITFRESGTGKYIFTNYLDNKLAGTSISTVISTSPTIQLANGEVLSDASLMIFAKKVKEDLQAGQQLITTREVGTGKYIFVAESE